MAKPSILFIQGGGAGAYEMDYQLVLYLGRALAGNYAILYPKMPGENDPAYDVWKAVIDKEVHQTVGKIVLIGHSVGAFLLIKYLLENKVDEKIAAAFFIAAPFVGDEGWSLKEIALADASFLKPLPVPLFFYHGTNDNTVPFTHLSLYAKRLPQATIRKIIGRGHQLDEDLSEVVHDINTSLQLTNR